MSVSSGTGSPGSPGQTAGVCACMYLKETGVEMEVVTVAVARFPQLIVQYSAVLRLAD